MASAPSNASVEQHRVPAARAAHASRRPQPLIDALVPDAHLNAAVAGIRGLGLGGMRVMALGPSWTSPGLWSRHTAGRAVWAERGARPPPRWGTGSRAAGSRAWPAGRLPEPRGDDRPDALARSGWDGVVLPFPGRDVLQQVRDKSRLEADRRGGGSRDPRGAFRGHRRRACRAPLRWPVVVKPARPVSALKTARLVRRRGGAATAAGRPSPAPSAAGPGARAGPARVDRAGDRPGGAPGRPLPAGDAPHVALGGRLDRPRDERRAGRGPRVPHGGDAGGARVLGTRAGRLRRDARPASRCST